MMTDNSPQQKFSKHAMRRVGDWCPGGGPHTVSGSYSPGDMTPDGSTVHCRVCGRDLKPRFNVYSTFLGLPRHKLLD